MLCPKCNWPDSAVLGTRYIENRDEIKRRRKCLHCLTRYSTYEKKSTERSEHDPLLRKY